MKHGDGGNFEIEHEFIFIYLFIYFLANAKFLAVTNIVKTLKYSFSSHFIMPFIGAL